MKLQQVIVEHGMEGYGFYWMCVEVVAQQGSNNRLSSEKPWKNTLVYISRVSLGKVDSFLGTFANLNLIDKEALEIGDLFIPKISEYSDEYTEKKRRVSGQGRDIVGKEEKRREEEVEEKKTYGEFCKVLLTDAEYQKLVERMGEHNTNLMIDELDTGIASKGYKYSSHYATILSWSRKRVRDFNKEQSNKKKVLR